MSENRAGERRGEIEWVVERGFREGMLERV